MASLSREQARNVIEKICKRNGGVTRDRRNALAITDPDTLESIDSLREQLGASVKTLATDLYNTDTRFVFELIQNAEDNKYDRANREVSEPFLTFDVYPDKIIVDSNEDGFEENNVKAICRVGHSTKKEQQGYVGEKGIGFKSVFKVACDVHIQSEPFSFFFEYSHGDSGMGMLTPFYREHESDVPHHVRTRMTLKLANDTRITRLLEGFSELPDTLLMFLSKIRRLTVATHTPDRLESKVIYSYETIGQRAKLSKYSEVVGTPGWETIRRYHITKRTIRDLPQAIARPKTKQVEIVLAFPLDPESIPIIEQQYVFAYLPVRQVGFSFLIQSDFITPTNREDIPDSDWNQTIRNGIAETFRDAVLQFCQHPTLQYQWMRYLPSRNVPGPFWDRLLEKILTLLKHTHILRSWNGTLKQPHQLTRLTHDALDKYGNPLFNDLPHELYLSNKYQIEDMQALQSLGVRNINMTEILARVRADLSTSNSKLKSPYTDEDWHTRTASLLLTPFGKDWPAEFRQMIRKLELIPLQDGDWISQELESAFNPGSETVPVPTDLGIRLVDRKALKNESRKKLFVELGVGDCRPGDVISRIVTKYKALPVNANVQSSVMHLWYLYWKLPKEEASLDPYIYVLDHESVPVYRNSVLTARVLRIVDDLYFETDDEFGAKKLLSKSINGDRLLAPGYPAHFINPAYLSPKFVSASHNHVTWKGWLERFAHVQRVPRLIRPGCTEISDVFRYIIKHRNDKLVGLLKEHWSSYVDLMADQKVVDELSTACVTCEDVGNTPLKDTYMPLPKLKHICKELGVAGKLPFLKLSVEAGETPGKDWDFLERFQVGWEADLPFYGKILSAVVQANKSFSPDLDPKTKQNLFRIYEELGRQCWTVDDRSTIKEEIRQLFKSHEAVYVPARKERHALWAAPDMCVWKAPNYYDQSFPLALLESYAKSNRVGHLFKEILEIEDTGYLNDLDQLKAQKDRSEDCMVLLDIYRHISQISPDASDWVPIRKQFEVYKLVYVPSRKGWVSPSSCLWTDNTRISGKHAIAAQYADFQAFFVDRLGVQKPDLPMYVNEMIKLANDEEPPAISRVKDLVRDISTLGPTKEALAGLRLCRILPVKDTDGQISLKMSTSIFAIVDRVQHQEWFKAKVPMLDFSIEEVHEWRSFLFALSLECKFITQTFKQTTTANDSTIDLVLSREMQEKAFAIFRCAVHYRVADSLDHSLYRQFVALDVYRSSAITRSISISLDGTEVTVEGASANLHIEDDVLQFRLYVPKDEESRELCYLSQIPEQIVSHLKITDRSATKVIGDLIKCTRATLLNSLLEDHGIVTVRGIEPLAPPTVLEIRTAPQPNPLTRSSTARHSSDSRTDVPGQGSSSPTPRRPTSGGIVSLTGVEQHLPSAITNVRTKPQPGLNTRSPVIIYPSGPQRSGHDPEGSTPRYRRNASSNSIGSGDASSDEDSTSLTADPFRRRDGTPLSSVSPGSSRRSVAAVPDQPVFRSEYIDLLRKIVVSAAIDSFPRYSPTAPAPVADPELNVLPDDIFGKRSDGQMSHDTNIGAAGELYVFEMLLKQNLINFGRNNWKSTIRDRVCGHEKYRDMGPWRGAETADIVYDDVGPDFKLTRLLESLGYLRAGNSSVKYYLEVKTTKNECGTRLFVSRAQYKRMRKMILHEDQAATEVYIILRVFNLGKSNMGMRLYVDPAAMEDSGELIFEPESYTVAPAPNRQPIPPSASAEDSDLDL